MTIRNQMILATSILSIAFSAGAMAQDASKAAVSAPVVTTAPAETVKADTSVKKDATVKKHKKHHHTKMVKKDQTTSEANPAPVETK